jgi:hypothetical protein
MRLAPQQVEQLKNVLQTKFKNPCHVCGSGNWQFDDVIFEVRQFMGGGVSNEGVIKPAVAVTCGDCGNIVLLNAFAVGALRVQQVPQGQQANTANTANAGGQPGAQPSAAKPAAIEADNADNIKAGAKKKK